MVAAVIAIVAPVGLLADVGAARAAIPFTDLPPAPAPPQVIFPAEDGSVSQATDAIQLQTHEGDLSWLTVATSPMTTDEQFGRPPSSMGPELAQKVAVAFAGGIGATRVPLSGIQRTLPPGRYWFTFLWNYDKAYEVCFVVTPTGQCDPTFPFGTGHVQALRFSPVRSFVIAAPPPSAQPVAPPTAQPTGAVAKRQARPAACAGYKAALKRNTTLLLRAKKATKTASTKRGKHLARARVARIKVTRVRLVQLRTKTCRLV